MVEEKIASDVASLSSGKYRWSTGNTDPGPVLRAGAGTPECKAD